MRTATFGLLVLATASSFALAGCGRKNLPVAPHGVSSVSAEDNNPSSLQNFQRSNRVTSGGGSDLRITPAEVANNPGQPKRPFLLDGLLN